MNDECTRCGFKITENFTAIFFYNYEKLCPNCAEILVTNIIESNKVYTIKQVSTWRNRRAYVILEALNTVLLEIMIKNFNEDDYI